MFQAPSSLACNTARSGAATAAVGSAGQGLSSLRGKNFSCVSSPSLPSVSGKPLGLAPSLQALVHSPSRVSAGPAAGSERPQEGAPGEGLGEHWGRECHHEGSKQGLVWPSGREGTGLALRPCQLELGAPECGWQRAVGEACSSKGTGF